MNFSFARCTECGRSVKMEVNAILSEIKCECDNNSELIPPKKDKPKRTRKKVENNDTLTF